MLNFIEKKYCLCVVIQQNAALFKLTKQNIPVWNMSRIVSQGIDNAAECEQALVDLTSFPCSHLHQNSKILQQKSQEWSSMYR